MFYIYVLYLCSIFMPYLHEFKSINNWKHDHTPEWPDEQQWPLHTWDYVYSKISSSHLSSKYIKSPTELTVVT